MFAKDADGQPWSGYNGRGQQAFHVVCGLHVGSCAGAGASILDLYDPEAFEFAVDIVTKKVGMVACVCWL